MFNIREKKGGAAATGQALNFYMGANSWMEPLPGLSRAPELVNNAYEENMKNVTGRGISILISISQVFSFTWIWNQW